MAKKPARKATKKKVLTDLGPREETAKSVKAGYVFKVGYVPCAIARKRAALSLWLVVISGLLAVR
jgi:hypothetical protein